MAGWTWAVLGNLADWEGLDLHQVTSCADVPQAGWGVHP